MITFDDITKCFGKTPKELRKIIKGEYKIKVHGFSPFTAAIWRVKTRKQP
jgi:hypothetical protein